MGVRAKKPIKVQQMYEKLMQTRRIAQGHRKLEKLVTGRTVSRPESQYINRWQHIAIQFRVFLTGESLGRESQ